ncbi:hypothetical protein CEXT_539021 [Caerostris extrusa]|uniref:Secreted protein n=1 Tax=Caerostris extrusa TaxID=172846 RepID=A0AAV4RG09_CAEEX|nr:hypothetical protein CEXT_539021 [Caerostris extrusa]
MIGTFESFFSFCLFSWIEAVLLTEVLFEHSGISRSPRSPTCTRSARNCRSSGGKMGELDYWSSGHSRNWLILSSSCSVHTHEPPLRHPPACPRRT